VKECTETKAKAIELKDGATQLSTEVTNTMAKLTESEKKVGDEDVQVKTALDKASEAQTKSREGYEKVQRALSTVRDIALALNNLDQISKLNKTAYYLHVNATCILYL
jgi:methyl-accepting chemotaxis protein